MARAKKQNTLLDALKFVLLAQRDQKIAQSDQIGTLRSFCQLSNCSVSNSDGILTASHPIEEDLECRPHMIKFIAALSNCGSNISISELQNNTLTVRSGKYFASVPCHDAEIEAYQPDSAEVPVSDVLKDGFKKIGHISKEDGQTVYQSSLLLRSGSMITTNGFQAQEFWHGLNIPTLAVPKSFVFAVSKVTKPVVYLGFSQSTCTFWFEDKSWIKTQLFADPWPDIDGALNMPELPIVDLPRGFFKGVEAVQEFSEYGKEKGCVYLSEEGISSHNNKVEGAMYNMKGLGNLVLNLRELKNIKNCCDKIAFDEHRLFFFSDLVRGVLMGIKD